MTLIFLALDLDTHTGCALHNADDQITCGTQHFAPHRFEGGGMRTLGVMHWLGEMHAMSIEALFFEEARRDADIDAMRAPGHTPCDDNAADALALPLWARERFQEAIA